MRLQPFCLCFSVLHWKSLLQQQKKTPKLRKKRPEDPCRSHTNFYVIRERAADGQNNFLCSPNRPAQVSSKQFARSGGWACDLQSSRMVQTMPNICSQVVNWVFEFELVRYGAGYSVVKRRFHTSVSSTSNSVSVWSGTFRGTTALESELAWGKLKISRKTT